jgi:hypothetical protein
MVLSQNIAPVFIQNTAMTKYFSISKPASPADHNKTNIYA